MPGNANSGRRKTTVDNRAAIDIDDRPTKPSEMDQHASEFWDESIAPVEHLRASDERSAIECCRMYSLYRRAAKACESIPLDDEAATTTMKYYGAWQKLSTKLGLHPEARIRMAKQTYRAEPTDELDADLRYFGNTG